MFVKNESTSLWHCTCTCSKMLYFTDFVDKDTERKLLPILISLGTQTDKYAVQKCLCIHRP